MIVAGGSCECPPKRLNWSAVPDSSASLAFDGFDIYRNLANQFRLMKENVKKALFSEPFSFTPKK